MRAIAPAHIAEPQPLRIGQKPAAIDRIVLEHHQGVEQLAQAGQALDLRQPEMLVRHQPRLAVLHLLEQARAGVCPPALSRAAAAC